MKRLLRGLLALGLFLALLCLLLPALVLQREPLVSDARAPTAERLAQAREALRRNDPRGQPPGERQLRLGEAELELLMDLGLNRWRPGASELSLGAGQARLRLSVELPVPGPWRWLNLDSDWREAGPQAIWPDLQRLRLGPVPLPSSLSGWLLHQGARQALGEADLQLARGMLRHLGFAAGQLALRYEWRADSAQLIAHRLWPPAEQARLLAYQQAMVDLARARPAGSAVSLADWLGPLLQLAAQRSAGDARLAAAENRALILSLGLYASRESWGRFLPAARDWPRPRAQTLTLAGRDDCALHLLISAVIAIEGGGPIADAIGLYKEMADTRGGSGFSFNDLAADLAGRRLGQLAQEQPLRLQALAQAGLKEGDFMPSVADLPEFLGREQLQQHYDGLGGPRYQAMMTRIEARVAALPWYR
jgi:hypothetical protein